MLSVSELNVSIGAIPILKDVRLAADAGEIICLIGPNGAGKSTLLKCLNRIISPFSGRIIINDRPIGAYPPRELARTIAYVPQQTGPGLSMQVIDVIALGRAPYAGLTTKAENRAIVSMVIERLQLTSLAFRCLGDLSGGQRQRVLIARAMAQQGQLFLMDEPTSSLDPHFQLELLSTVKAIAKEDKVAVLMAVHDLSLAARLADHIVLMKKGQIRAQGDWKSVLTSDSISETFGIDMIIGSDGGTPYVIPIPLREPL